MSHTIEECEIADRDLREACREIADSGSCEDSMIAVLRAIRKRAETIGLTFAEICEESAR